MRSEPHGAPAESPRPAAGAIAATPVASPSKTESPRVDRVDAASLNSETVPAWAADAIFYQLFPERFYNGDKSNDPTRESLESPDSVPKSWAISPWTGEWYARADWEKEEGPSFFENGVFDRRYGGDLQGVIEKLDDDELASDRVAGRRLLLTGLTVSLNELAVGFLLGVLGVPLGPALGYIAGQAFALTFLGLALGRRLGAWLGERAELASGVVLLLLGVALFVGEATGSHF